MTYARSGIWSCKSNMKDWWRACYKNYTAEFHRWKFRHSSSPRMQMSQLLRVTRHWLQPDHLAAEVVTESVAMDHFLRAVPGELQKAVGLKDPSTAQEMVEATEAADFILSPGERWWRKRSNGCWHWESLSPPIVPGQALLC
uniref:SCAN box domain-containing protein n=1 Tax=Astyanax mexicanus TaxID=7994 RepID=A0A3B1K349_ASTMX